MIKPNINTFAPAENVKPSFFELPKFKDGNAIVVVGAGAFGGWTSLYLQRKGFNVTLVDAFGAGNSRSSSGDETRVIRSTYGNNKTYFDLNVRALELWKENQQRFQKKLFFNTGALWFCYNSNTPIVDDSIPFAETHGMPYEYLLPAEIKSRHPVINVDDLHHAYFDPFAGYLKARESCQVVVDTFISEGGGFIQNYATPGRIAEKRLQSILLTNEEHIKADAYIFACGPWLGKLFPEVLGKHITCTKQEVYYFGAPEKFSKSFDDLPVWIDVDDENFYYGICNNAHRGFKIGIDKRGEIFNPSEDERIITSEILEKAKSFIAHRFPKLKGAPLVESRVCPYENSPDGNFIFDLHPETENLFFLGGGSGHGFKHGPALGELVAKVLKGESNAPSIFSLARF
jgi:glycine/D-amino acid oxidase-like deaminating enzyme